ncbi:MAG: hypothetical protein Q4D88_03000 [Anaerococcus sp.]|nr:hypothetical protein [Anaerococcus sp.]
MGILSKSLTRIGEFIIFVFLSIIYTSIILLPIILINLLLKEVLIKYLLLFIPLIGLVGFSLEREFISIREAYVNYRPYAKPYFRKVFTKDSLSKYLAYTLVFSLYFYSADALRILEKDMVIFGVVRIVLAFSLRNIIFYMILQNAFRSRVDFLIGVKNSLILTYKNLFYSIMVFAIWGILEYLMVKNILWTYPFVIIMGLFGVLINEYSIKNL